MGQWLGGAGLPPGTGKIAAAVMGFLDPSSRGGAMLLFGEVAHDFVDRRIRDHQRHRLLQCLAQRMLFIHPCDVE